ncbi:MAG: hypothetical protein Kow0092_37700 [Deferrisomatales bacterium]
MRVLTESVKAFVRDLGADLVGVASAEAVDREAREFQRPEGSLPGAQAVVSFGVRTLDSVFRSPNIRIARASYVHYHHRIDDLAWKVATYLEDRGFDAIPIPSTVPVEMKERGGVLGDLSLRHAAVQAGLGRVGRSRNFLSPRFGARVRLGSVITTAPLAPDEPLDEEVCLGEACGRCLEACPGQALDGETFAVKKCLSVMHKYNLYGLLKLLGRVLDAEDLEEKKGLVFDGTLGEIYMSLRAGDPPLCIRCVEVCPVGRRGAR